MINPILHRVKYLEGIATRARNRLGNTMLLDDNDLVERIYSLNDYLYGNTHGIIVFENNMGKK